MSAMIDLARNTKVGPSTPTSRDKHRERKIHRGLLDMDYEESTPFKTGRAPSLQYDNTTQRSSIRVSRIIQGDDDDFTVLNGMPSNFARRRSIATAKSPRTHPYPTPLSPSPTHDSPSPIEGRNRRSNSRQKRQRERDSSVEFKLPEKVDDLKLSSTTLTPPHSSSSRSSVTPSTSSSSSTPAVDSTLSKTKTFYCESSVPGSKLLCDLKFYEGKGFGLVATHPIRRGDLIISEAPFLRFFHDDLEQKVQSLFNRLEDMEKILFLSFTGTIDDIPEILCNICETNAISLSNTAEDDENSPAVESGLFEYICRVSHSCRPNTGWRWNENSSELALIAYRDIAKDEEIQVSYLSGKDLLMNSIYRRESLKSKFCFECHCETCNDKDRYGNVRSDNDLRIYRDGKEEWTQILDDLDNLADLAMNHTTNTKLKMLDVIDPVISFLENHVYVELQDALMARFHIMAAWADRRGAKEAAKKVIEQLKVVNGVDSPEVVKSDFQKWRHHPETAPSWGKCLDNSDDTDDPDYDARS